MLSPIVSIAIVDSSGSNDIYISVRVFVNATYPTPYDVAGVEATGTRAGAIARRNNAIATAREEIAGASAAVAGTGIEARVSRLTEQELMPLRLALIKRS